MVPPRPLDRHHREPRTRRADAARAGANAGVLRSAGRRAAAVDTVFRSAARSAERVLHACRRRSRSLPGGCLAGGRRAARGCRLLRRIPAGGVPPARVLRPDVLRSGNFAAGGGDRSSAERRNRRSRGGAMMNRRRVVLAVLAVVAVAGGLFAYTHFFREEPAPYFASDEEHFLYGSIGTEPDQGVPYWIWLVLPRIFPGRLPAPGGYASIGVLGRDGHEMPIGLSKVTVG